MRIAVIGAGASGLTSTWLLQPNFDVTCFEASSKVGGNVQWRTVHGSVGSIDVQLGPSYFLPKDYVALFRILSILEVPTAKVPMQLSIVDVEGSNLFVSPSLKPFRLGALANVSSAKDLMQLRTILYETLKLIKRSDTSTTWRQFVESLDVTRRFVSEVANPIASAFFGLSYEEVGSVSASFGLLYMALCLPTLTNGIQFGRTVIGGTHRWIEAIEKRIKPGTVQLNCPVQRIKPLSNGKVLVEHHTGQEVFDRAIVTVQPWEAAVLVDDERTASTLRKFPSFAAEVAIHNEPLLPSNRNGWSPAMIIAGPRSAQLSTHAGNLEGKDIYRSWITEGPKLPKVVLERHNYRHLFPLPEMINAQRQIQSINKKGAIYFAGAWTHDLDSHEAAVRSGIGAARVMGANNHLLSKIGFPKARYGFGTAQI